MRVIAGKFRSRQLRSTRGLEIRPTSDRLRETLFDVLTAGNPDALQGSIWLDLFAGTGAVGIEAISRGASTVYFVEQSRHAASVIKNNLDSLGVTAGFALLQQDAQSAIRDLQRTNISPSIVFLDPPYALANAYADTLRSIGESNWNALVIAEHEKKLELAEEFGSLRRRRRLVQGDAALSFFEVRPSGLHQ